MFLKVVDLNTGLRAHERAISVGFSSKPVPIPPCFSNMEVTMELKSQACARTLVFAYILNLGDRFQLRWFQRCMLVKINLKTSKNLLKNLKVWEIIAFGEQSLQLFFIRLDL